MFHLFLMFFVPHTEILNCLGRQHQKIWTEPKYFIIFLVSSLVNLLFIVTQAFLTSVYIFNTWPIMSSNFSFVRLYKLLMSFFMFKAAFSRAALLLNIFKFCWPWFWTKKKKKGKRRHEIVLILSSLFSFGFQYGSGSVLLLSHFLPWNTSHVTWHLVWSWLMNTTVRWL